MTYAAIDAQAAVVLRGRVPGFGFPRPFAG